MARPSIVNDAKIDVTDKIGIFLCVLPVLIALQILGLKLLRVNSKLPVKSIANSCFTHGIDAYKFDYELINSTTKKVLKSRAYDGYSSMERLIENYQLLLKSDASDKCAILSKNTVDDSKQVTFDFHYLESFPEYKQL
ncbi:hypothetical protein TrispH2_006111 [Trichoplax sp. H2]|nr:hypothetical protein TrispH2_006111 [Trichoplax sp. H2]|eukprot:RDD41716.1 hypothetical protein TrispH2_006111 [Trichoplax sp. H2]